jgi:tRNA threonylcarbamoyladenosine modification (KEOPS) complex  Pcc1 subunit
MKAILEIEFDNPTIAKKALNSLKQEASFKKRSKAEMRVSGKTLLIQIEASEFPAMRATLHSYLRLLNVVFSVLNLTEKEV